MCAGTASGGCLAAPGHPPAPDLAVPLEPLRTLTGSEWLELARAARPQLAQWVAPLDPADYQIGLGRLAERRWAAGQAPSAWNAGHSGNTAG